MASHSLICCDIDGTLLDPEHRITARTRTAVASVVESGYTFALVSGRSPQSLALLREQLGIEAARGCFNGALTLSQDGTLIDEQPIDYSEAMRALDELAHTELEFFLYTNTNWYVQQHNHWYDAEVKLTCIDGTIASLDTVHHYLDGTEKPMKLLAMHKSRSYIREMTQILTTHFAGRLNIFNSHPNYIEILPPEADKGRSVRALEAHLSLPASSVIAIGDYYNDIPMFRSAGLAIAMGNAPPEVQRSAHRTIGANKEDGLAQFLESLV